MAKVLLLGHQSVKEGALKCLQDAGLLQLIRIELPKLQSEEVKLDFEAALIELQAALNFLETVSGRKKTLLESFAPEREAVDEETLLSAYREFNWKEQISGISTLETEFANLHNLENKLRTEIELLKPWRDLPLKLSDLSCAKKTCVFLGKCKLKDFEDFKIKLARFTSCFEISLVNRSKNEVYLLILYLRVEEKVLGDFLAKTEFTRAHLPASPRTPAQEIDHLRALLNAAMEHQAQLQAEARLLLKYKSRLMYVYDYLHLKKGEREAREKLLVTPRLFALAGWIRRPDLNKLKTRLSKISPALEVQEIAPGKGEIPPTALKNLRPFRPFELITQIFGVPSQGEMDPTAPLSFFYLLFFAICLSDAGYGVILAALSYYLLKKLKLAEGGKNLVTLLFWGGILTIFAGIFTGSYFGLDLAKLPPGFIKDLVLRLQLIDPVKNPLNVLILSLFIGVFQNLFGLVLGMYTKFKNQEYLAGILDFGFWIYFLTSLVGLTVTLALKSTLSVLFSYLSISGAISLVLTQGRNESHPLKKALIGILSLYRTTSFLGDTLSYSRLLALMMTTSIIGMVINILADLTRNSIPILGYVIMVLILLVGHTFNLVVSTLGAFIHSMRLQLVEFFGKFYEGGGKSFRPYRRETKYVWLKEELA
jgi:V/A-type H+-transporting ATPase subunit I